MAIIIPIKNNPNHTLTIDLDSKIFKLWFLYNTIGSFWTFTLYDNEDNILISNIKILANYPLLFAHRNIDLPSGDFYCQTTDITKTITRNSFASSEAQFLYLTSEEITL
tara:strand:+ start:404 stop:730 length:327 start_codon:yes stop_codon:yes gene_type:complete